VALGLPTNKAFLAAVLRDEKFATQGATTDFISRPSPVIEAHPDAATLASAAALLATTAGYGEWNCWSNNPERLMKVKFDKADIDLRNAGGMFRANIGDAEINLRILALDSPHARVSIDDREETVTFVLEGDTVHLACAGQSVTLENTTHAPPAARGIVASDGRLTAPMNGRVVAVNVEVGDTAQPAHALVVLEAMKMEHA